VDLDSELTNRVADRSCDANRSGRAVERQEEASTRGVNLMSSKPCQLGANERMVALEQHAPLSVAKPGCERRRPDDVRKEHGREHRLVLALLDEAVQKALDDVRELDPEPDEHARARELEQTRMADAVGHVACRADAVCPTQDEHRNADSGKYAADVRFAHHAIENRRRRRTPGLPEIGHPPLAKARVLRKARVSRAHERFEKLLLTPLVANTCDELTPLAF